MPPLFVAVFMAAVVLGLPLRMVLGWLDADAAGLSAARVEGTVWSGTLHGAAVRGVVLGDARVGLDLLGAPGVRISGEGGRGVLRLGEGFGVRDVDAALPLDRIAPRTALGGALNLRDLSVDFRNGACRSASGQVSLDEVRLGGAAIPGMALTGRASCRDGALMIPLAGQGAGVNVEAELRIDGAGGYRLTTRLRATDPLVGAAARGAGFEQGLNGFVRTDAGRLG